jgi:hypothetical protein
MATEKNHILTSGMSKDFQSTTPEQAIFNKSACSFSLKKHKIAMVTINRALTPQQKYPFLL